MNLKNIPNRAQCIYSDVTVQNLDYSLTACHHFPKQHWTLVCRNLFFV